MHQRKAHHHVKHIGKIRPHYLLAATAVCGVVSLGALRANYQHMTELREAVYTADREGGDVQGALQELQAYVTTHMNTDLSSGANAVHPPIQLKHTYERLVRDQGDKLASANGQLYTAAQAHCEAQNPNDFSGRNRVPCIEQYIRERGGQQAEPIRDDLYKFDFASPRWSPDLAGWSLVATILLALLTVASFITRRFSK